MWGYDDDFIGDRYPTVIAALQWFTPEWPFQPGETSTLAPPGTLYLMHDGIRARLVARELPLQTNLKFSVRYETFQYLNHS